MMLHQLANKQILDGPATMYTAMTWHSRCTVTPGHTFETMPCFDDDGYGMNPGEHFRFYLDPYTAVHHELNETYSVSNAHCWKGVKKLSGLLDNLYLLPPEERLDQIWIMQLDSQTASEVLRGETRPYFSPRYKAFNGLLGQPSKPFPHRLHHTVLQAKCFNFGPISPPYFMDTRTMNSFQVCTCIQIVELKTRIV